MGRSIAFFCGPEDDEALRAYMTSIGLTILPGLLDMLEDYPVYPPTDDPTSGGLLSFLPIEDLHPYGDPPTRIGSATDPLLGFTRAYYRKPYLVAGNVRWSSDNPDLAKQSKRYFARLTKWAKDHWHRRAEDGYYIGPSAKALAEQPGTIISYFPPGIEIEYKRI